MHENEVNFSLQVIDLFLLEDSLSLRRNDVANGGRELMSQRILLVFIGISGIQRNLFLLPVP